MDFVTDIMPNTITIAAEFSTSPQNFGAVSKFSKNH